MNNYIPVISAVDAANLLLEVFGAPKYNISDSKENNQISSYIVSMFEADEYDRLSQFGTPVVGSFTIKGGKYQVYSKTTGKLEDKEYSDFEFPLATIVDISRPKNITKTPTIGANGTVKEIFGFDDAKISIRGLCLNDESRQTEKKAIEQKQALWKLNEIAGSLEILKGKIFTNLEITNIVMEDIQFSAVQGKPDVIQFEIPATSDIPFLLME